MPISNDKIRVYIWPDYVWCYSEDLESYQWKSDDFKIILIDTTHLEKLENIDFIKYLHDGGKHE